MQTLICRQLGEREAPQASGHWPFALPLVRTAPRIQHLPQTLPQVSTFVEPLRLPLAPVPPQAQSSAHVEHVRQTYTVDSWEVGPSPNQMPIAANAGYTLFGMGSRNTPSIMGAQTPSQARLDSLPTEPKWVVTGGRTVTEAVRQWFERYPADNYPRALKDWTPSDINRLDQASRKNYGCRKVIAQAYMELNPLHQKVEAIGIHRLIETYEPDKIEKLTRSICQKRVAEGLAARRQRHWAAG